MQDFVIIFAHQSELESVFCRIDRNGARFGIAIEAVHNFALDASEVYGLLKSFDDTIVTLRQCILDVVQGRVDQDTTVVPGTRLDADRLVDHGALSQ